jgi:hypothetical protein
VGGPISESSTIDRWAVAAATILMVRDLDSKEFRETVEQLVRAMERAGLAVHRDADRLEERSVFLVEVTPSDHTREAILARLSQDFTEQHWRIAEAYLARLVDDFEDPDLLPPQIAALLRQQAATILDAAQLLREVLAWHADRADLLYPSRKGHLENDTIATIMLDWNVTPTETVRELAKHRLTVTVGALAMALSRQRERSETSNELTPPWRIRLLP